MVFVAVTGKQEEIDGQEKNTERMVLGDVAPLVHAQVFGWGNAVENAIAKGKSRYSHSITNLANDAIAHVEVDYPWAQAWNASVRESYSNA